MHRTRPGKAKSGGKMQKTQRDSRSVLSLQFSMDMIESTFGSLYPKAWSKATVRVALSNTRWSGSMGNHFYHSEFSVAGIIDECTGSITRRWGFAVESFQERFEAGKMGGQWQ